MNLWRWISLVALSVGCGGPVGPFAPSHSNSALGAIVATGAAVAEVAVYRATQNGCWGQCGAGAECNQETGLCERIPCGGRCSGDSVCEQRGDQEACVPPDLAFPSAQARCAPDPDAGSLLVVACTDAGASAR